MSVIIKLNESSATLRVVPLPPLVQSNGTSACTNESGNTFFFSVGGIYYGSGGSISAVSAPIGLYECLFSASKVSVAGQGAIHYSSGTALPARTPIEVVRFDSYDSMRFGQFALPNAAAEAAGGLITFGTSTGQLHVSSGSVGLKAQTHSQSTIGGINNILEGNYSGRSFEILTGGIQPSSVGKGAYSGVSVEITTKGIGTNSITSATYSAVSFRLDAQDYGSIITVGVSNIKAASYSGVSVEVKTGGIQTTSYGAGSYSGVSVEVKSGGIQTSSVGAGSYSGVSVEVKTGGIQPASMGAGAYSGVTVDGAKFLSVAGERSAASSLLSTNMGSSRLYQEYLWSMRNKISISGSTATVFLPDDVTSAYTMSVTTAVSSVQGVDGGGRA